MTTFSSRLKAARKARGLSQVELASRVGVDPIVISRYERAVMGPSLRRAEALAGALDVTLDWLIAGTGEGPALEEPISAA